VLIYRLPARQSIMGRSRCPHCGRVLEWYDLVPVLSYVFLRAKCRKCRKRISPQYIAVELLTGILFVIAYQYSLLGDGTIDYHRLLLLLGLSSCAVLTSVIDLKYYLILDKLNIFFGIYFFILALAYDITHWTHITESKVVAGLIATVILGSLLFILNRTTKGRGMGLGDVKFSPILGFGLGLYGSFFALLIASWVGAIFGVFLMLLGKINRKTPLPFGVFLSLGLLLTVYFEDKLLLLAFTWL